MSAVTLVAIGLLVGGCGALQPRAPEPVSTHVLASRPAPPASSARRDAVIEVATPRAWPGFDSVDMIYARGPYELERYATHQWVDTPPRMLAPLIVRALEDSRAFRAVVAAPATVPADYRLDTEIVRLVQEFGARPSKATIVVRVQLTDLRGRRPVATAVFEEAENTATEDAPGGVVAANAALTRILAEVTRFCLEGTARP